MTTILPCTDGNLRECALLLKLVYSEPPYGENWSPEKAFEYLHKFHCMDSAGCYVAQNDNKIVGVIIGYSFPWSTGVSFFIQELFVDSEFRGKGIGKKLILHAAGSLDEEPTILLIARDGSQATNFYKGLGLSKNEHYNFYSGKVRT